MRKPPHNIFLSSRLEAITTLDFLRTYSLLLTFWWHSSTVSGTWFLSIILLSSPILSKTNHISSHPRRWYLWNAPESDFRHGLLALMLVIVGCPWFSLFPCYILLTFFSPLLYVNHVTCKLCTSNRIHWLFWFELERTLLHQTLLRSALITYSSFLSPA